MWPTRNCDLLLPPLGQINAFWKALQRAGLVTGVVRWPREGRVRSWTFRRMLRSPQCWSAMGGSLHGQAAGQWKPRQPCLAWCPKAILRGTAWHRPDFPEGLFATRLKMWTHTDRGAGVGIGFARRDRWALAPRAVASRVCLLLEVGLRM